MLLNNKLNIFSLFFLTCALFACNKETGNTPETKTYSVSFNIDQSGFTQEIGSTDTKVKTIAADSLSKYINEIYYIVYDKDQNAVDTMYQRSGYLADFGLFSNRLESGSYTLVFIGTKDHIIVSPAKQLHDFSISADSLNNTYIRKMSFVVGADSLKQSITLNRIIAKLQVVIKDIIPPNAKYIKISIPTDKRSYSLYTELPLEIMTSTESKPLNSSDIGKPNYTLSMCLLNTATPNTVILTCLNANNEVIAQKTITNVICQKNKITVLSGSLFTNTSSSSLSINSLWSGSTNNQSF